MTTSLLSRLPLFPLLRILPLFPLLLFAAGTEGRAGDSITITAVLHHLGDTKKPEWKEFTTVDPVHPTQKALEFEAKESSRELVLEVHAGGVGYDWKLKLNGHELGSLEKKEALTAQYFRVPPATLRDGKNLLLVSADKTGDDIYVGKAAIHDRPIAELKGYARVSVRVRDADTRAGLPCRLTIVRRVEKREKAKERDKDGKEKEVEKVTTKEELVDVAAGKDDRLAARPGIVYTKDGAASFEIAPGDCVIYATHGFEYGVAEARLHLSRLETKAVDLEIRREVDTSGWLAADTHIHTKTYSGHGDINMEERVVAILGEGVEVAVATDHNHTTDYRPTLAKLSAQDELTSVIGDEVTTTIGHFNAFPFEKGAEPTEHDLTSWVRLVQAMRASPGVRVVILNHPQRALGKESPFAQIRLNPLTGEAHRGPDDLGLDAIEIANGKTLTDDRMQALNDWFGLLNRGYRMKAVAASDSHAVNEVVGQARTYVRSSTDDPRKIQISEICDSFLAGRLLPCLGLLTQVEVNGKYQVGDLVTGLGEGRTRELEVKITVQGPSWTRADRVALYLNGAEVKKEKLAEPAGTGAGVKLQATWRIPAPRHDAFLVAVASGPAVTALYWPIAGGEKKYVMGATNPVWIDGDGDGKFTSAFDYASAIARDRGLSGSSAESALAEYDGAVAAQFASIARAKIRREAQEAYARIMAEADGKLSDLLGVKDAALKKTFTDYLAAAPRVEVRTREEEAAEAARLKKEEDDRRKRREEAEKKRKEEEEKKRREEERRRHEARSAPEKRPAGRKGRL